MVTFVPSYVNCTDPEGATLEQVAGILVMLFCVHPLIPPPQPACFLVLRGQTLLSH